MTDIVSIAGSRGSKNLMLDLFSIPPTDTSVLSSRYVPIQQFTTGIHPITFQVDPQTDYIDFSRSFIELEVALKKTGGNLGSADKLYPANNLAHTMFKQINVKLNDVLISPQTDTYHYKAMLETLTNYDRTDGETILRPQGWFNGVNMPKEFTKTNVVMAESDFKSLSTSSQESVSGMLHEQQHYLNGKKHILRFRPHIPLFWLSKFLVPGIQITIEMYLNSPNIFMNGVDLEGKMDSDQLKAKLYLCQVRLNPSTYLELSDVRKNSNGVVVYPVVRGDIRTFNIASDLTYYECTNIFPEMVPNRIIAVLVTADAFTGKVEKDPFAFQSFGLTSIKQLIGGEEYPYETLEISATDDHRDNRGYQRFLQATGCYRQGRGNMVRHEEWGRNKSATLFVFDNTANGNLDSPHLHPKLSGNTKLVLNFASAPGENLTLIVYGEFENLIEVYGNDAVFYDIYRNK